jgi:hypothetical protein
MLRLLSLLDRATVTFEGACRSPESLTASVDHKFQIFAPYVHLPVVPVTIPYHVLGAITLEYAMWFICLVALFDQDWSSGGRHISVSKRRTVPSR